MSVFKSECNAVNMKGSMKESIDSERRNRVRTDHVSSEPLSTVSPGYHRGGKAPPPRGGPLPRAPGNWKSGLLSNRT